MKKQVPFLFLLLGLLALLTGMGFGLLANMQILFPEFLKNWLPFNQVRPLHVSSMVGWIILAATGGVYLYSSRELKNQWKPSGFPRMHLILFFFSACAIYVSYFILKMGGREYLNFHPVIAIPIFAGWILFAVQYFRSHWNRPQWPVYAWMWGTGIVFMMIHLGEAYLWLLPSVREVFIRDITIQWKAYGSFVGSWNMLVYGTALYLMAHIKKDSSVAMSREAFFFYFLGLTNLMFGWAHHTYVIPTRPWIRGVAYIISMTEWIVLLHILFNWIRSLDAPTLKEHSGSLKFLKSADAWVFLNLFMALLISIPAIQIYTHGTYVTVAHSMGTTIGINTSILMASAIFICGLFGDGKSFYLNKMARVGYWLFNGSFLGFWLSLIWAGVHKAKLLSHDPNIPFSQIQAQLSPAYWVMLITGLGLCTGLCLVIFQVISALVGFLRADVGSDVRAL